MTPPMAHVPRGPALPAAAIAALLLAGCSSGHIGDSWQCPLATGGSCSSVAAADPAVPDADGARKSVLTEPLWRARYDRMPETPPKTSCESDCDGGFDPFGWLMRLFGGGEDDEPSAEKKTPAGEFAAPSPVAPQTAKTRPEGPEAAALPAEPGRPENNERADDLRSGEVVARIWIAPFVDANGVYREASHVRVVLEPAGWRLR